MGSGTAIRRRLLATAATAILLGLAQASPARADVLLDESFSGPTASIPLGVSGSFLPCLTASTDTGQGNVAGCAAGQPSIPAGGDPDGQGALRLTDNAHDRSGSAIYRHAFPFTQGVRFTFTTFAYDGTRVPGYGAADGISVFLADGAVGATRPGAFGGSLGYAQKAVDFDATVPDIGGVPGGYLGVGIDEFGNFANDREARGYGCAQRVDTDLHPDYVSVRGAGVAGSGWLRGYCLLDREPTPAPGVLDQPDATSRFATGVAHTFRIEVDPLGNPDGTPNAAAHVRVLADMTNAGLFVPVLDAPLPPDPPATFAFGLAASTGLGTNVHEIRALRLETVDELPRWTLAKTHERPLAAGATGSFTVQAALAPDGGAAYAPVVLEDQLPDGLTLAAVPHGSGWSCDASVAGSTVARCTHEASLTDPIRPGTRLPALVVPVRVAPDADGRLVNVARLSGEEILDPIEAEDPFQLRRAADVGIVKHATPTRIEAGGRTSFTLVITNHGPADATGVTVLDRPPDGLVFDAALPSQGDCGRTARALRCTLGSMRAGASAQIVVDASALPAATGRTLRNVALVTAAADDDPRNNRSAAEVEVVASGGPDPPPAPAPGPGPGPEPPSGAALLEVEKSADHDRVRLGAPVRYTIRMRNSGTATAHDVLLTDTSTLSGTIRTASATARTCARADGLIRCQIGDIAPGEVRAIQATVTYDRVGHAVDTVSLVPAAGTLAARIDSARVRVIGGTGLRIAKTADRTRARPHEPIRYRIAVRATGDRPAHAVRVCDRLPAELRLVAAPGADGRRAVCWRLAQLAPGTTRTFTLRAQATRTAARLVNVAVARARGTDAVAASATVAVAVPRRPTACAAVTVRAVQAC